MIFHRIVVDPGLDRQPTLELEVLLRRISTAEKPGWGRFVGSQAVDIDSDMVVVDVPEFEVLDCVEFDGKDVVGEVADDGGVEDAEVLAGKGSRERL